MKRTILFTLLVAISFILDWTFSFVGVGVMWLLPIIYFSALLTSKKIEDEVLLFAFLAIAIDVFSGFNFGIVTLAFLICYSTLIIASRWLHIRPKSVLTFLSSTLIMLVEFYLILYVAR